MNYREKIKKEIEESANIKRLLMDNTLDQINKAVDILVRAIRKKDRIFLCGNGGSAADSQHIASELVGRLRKRELSHQAFSLATNISTLTALSNDFGYENVFSKQLEVYAQPKDILIAISTSGKSVNVKKAVKKAKEIGMKIIVMTGRKKTMISKLADVAIMVPSYDTPRIQEAHILIGHIFASMIEDAFHRRTKD
ncbi:MAG: hypothetical protein B5M53_10870 [Candidatus Cloacimonas sp. 4484_209]|nr:MAG: hypothetical protein B5M53_10870 [Candidatus Cloacimonas sp. 4484_209]